MIFGNGSLRLFKQDLSFIEKIDESEINDYIMLAKKGDINAKNRVIESNIDLVMKVANSYSKNENDYLDLIQTGITGIYDAIESYNSNQSKFSTYAVFWIKCRILKEVYKNSNVFNSSKLTLHLNNYRKLINGEEKISDEDLCKSLHVSKTTLNMIKQYDAITFMSADETINKETDSDRKVIDNIEDKNDYYNELNTNIDYKVFMAIAKEKLSKIEYYVVYNRVLNKSLESIGEPLNIKRGRVHQIYLNAIKKLNYIRNNVKEYKSILNLLKSKYNNIYNLNIEPSNIDDICKYLYLKNKLTEEERNIIYNVLFSLKPIDSIVDQELLDRVKYYFDNIDDAVYNEFKIEIIKEFGTFIFKLVDVNMDPANINENHPDFVKKYIKNYY